MTSSMQVYIAQVNEINRLMQRTELTPEAGLSLIDSIRRRSARVYGLLQSNNAIVQREVLPMLAQEHDLTAGEYDQLNAFAEALCTFAVYIDAALAFLIRKKLLAFAKAEGDTDRIIAQQYDIGIAAYLMYSEYEMFASFHVRQKVVPWFEANVAYLDRLPELSHVSRSYVLRSLNNESLVFNQKCYDQVDEYMTNLRRTRTVYLSEAVRALEPDINWTAYLRAVYRNTLRIADVLEHGYGLQYMPELQQAAKWLTADVVVDENAPELDQYSAIELEFIQHHIDAAEAIARMDAIYVRRDPLRFDRDGIDQNINIPSFSLLYEVQLHPPVISRINSKIDNIVTYVNGCHRKTGQYKYNYAVANFIRYYPDLPGVTPFRHVLESLLLALHVPTYVHSLMVSTLSRTIGRAVLAADPGCFIGFRGIATPEEAVERREELLTFIRYAGLFHDIGKCVCLDVITQYSRRLFDDEFAIIKMHAECGCEILREHPSTAPYAEVALMHHITYDRRGGYAKEFLPAREAVPMVSDIVRIADAVDAATDNIGRCYAACKNQAQIMEELVNSPQSYNPRMVAALMDPGAQEALRHALEDVRSDIYSRAYVVAPEAAGAAVS